MSPPRGCFPILRRGVRWVTSAAATLPSLYRLPFRAAFAFAWIIIQAVTRELFTTSNPGRRAQLIGRMSTAYDVMARLHPWARPSWPRYSAADLAACASLAGRVAAAELCVLISWPASGDAEQHAWSQLATSVDHLDRCGFLAQLAGLVQDRYSQLASSILLTFAATERALYTQTVKGTA